MFLSAAVLGVVVFRLSSVVNGMALAAVFTGLVVVLWHGGTDDRVSDAVAASGAAFP